MNMRFLIVACLILACALLTGALGEGIEPEDQLEIIVEEPIQPELEIEADGAPEGIDALPEDLSVDGLDGLALDLSEPATEPEPAARPNDGNTEFLTEYDTVIKYLGNGPVARVPDYITAIGIGAFEDCDGLTEVILPEGLVSIEGGAFEGCDGLREVTIPGNVIVIGDSAFEKCKSLVKVNLPGSLITIGPEAFRDCDALPSISIPGRVTTIGDGAFRYCDSLSTVNLENGLARIGELAFHETALTAIALPDSVTEVGVAAFGNCQNLVSATLSNGMTSVKDGLFRECKNLIRIAIPDGVTSIGAESFAFCERMIAVTLPKNLVSIADGAFHGCFALKELALPEGLVSIGADAFIDCDALTAISMPDTVNSIGSSAFSDCEALTRVTLSKGLTVIPNTAFRNASMAEIQLHEGLTSIGDRAFEGTNLRDVTLPESMTTLGSGAFSSCEYLKRIVIPAGVKVIEDNAFDGCTPTIVGQRGSYAETFAAAHQLTFRVLGEEEPQEEPQEEPEPSKAPESVALDRTGTVSLAQGGTLQLTASLTPADAVTALTWSSDDPEVATVSSSGLVKGVSEGVTTITVETDNGLWASVDVEVAAPAPTGVSITKGKSATLYMGNKLTLKAKVTPSGAATKLTWKSSKPKVATVSSKGVVTPKKAGTTVISVRTSNNKSAKITVKVVDASSVKLKEGKSATLKVGKKLTLHATVSPAKVKTRLTWTSSNKKVAIVTSKGVVKALKPGTAKVTVRTANGKTTSITITVK